MSDKGAELNKEVWKLFEKAGFDTKPSSSNQAEEVVILPGGKTRTPDLYASVKDLGVKIIGENTTEPNLSESFTTYIHDLRELMKASKANAGLYVLSNREISIEDRNYAAKNNIQVWGDDELQYYKAVADALGKYSKYEIIHSFRISTSEEKNIHNVLALRFQQPYVNSDADLFLFSIAPEKLLKTCVIYRRAQGRADAYQRMVKKSRLRKIKKHVTSDNALLPPNIIVHLNEKVIWNPLQIPAVDTSGKAITLAKEKDYELGILSIPLEYASLELIDGQHRLYGFVETDSATREKFNLVVLGMKGLSSERRRDTFVAINANSVRVDPNLVAFLKYTEDETECQKDNELMAIKLVVKLNETSPFKNKIKLIDVGPQKITLKGFSGYDLKTGLLGKGGLLRKYYPNESKEYISALRLYFGVIESIFKVETQNPGKYIIFTNRGISAFLKLLISILRHCRCPLDKAVVRRYLQPLKNNWTGGWETKKLKNSYVGSKGWKDFHRDLVKAIKVDIPDFKE